MIGLPDRAALLLDLDGTLLDIAPTPDSVVVAPGLAATLLRLREKLSGALAIVTGRPIATVDALLPGIATAVAGEHGGVIRHAPGGAERRTAVTPVPQDWLDRAQSWVAAHPGALFERKAAGFVLHYRLAEAAGPVFGEALARMLAGQSHHRLQAAHMAWEVTPAGIDKGSAVAAIMAQPPFAGRVPVFVGDDVTDEDGMRVAVAQSGLGLRVQDHFGDAAGVRRWLEGLSLGAAARGAPWG